MNKLLLIAAILPASAFAASTEMSPKPASKTTILVQARAQAILPSDDGRDARFADQGFLGTRKDPNIRDKNGNLVWNLDAYAWMGDSVPATVNPSLWRHQKLLARHGLYRVSEGIWQVRGFDVSNMTIISGQSGWILIDPLTTQEAASAALDLVNNILGKRPTSAVVYTHSHGDHYGGVRGVTTLADLQAGHVKIIAPDHFMEETASENVMAGPAMGRRATYQFGAGLAEGATGRLGSGIGSGLSVGNMTLLPPTNTIRKTGEILSVDGIELEFQMVPESEAPAEMNVMVPSARTLLVGEIATCSLHNILTPRGAKVRNAHKWAGYLNEAINLYAARTDTLIASHCWPRFGQGEVRSFLTFQRDNYKFLHDQTVRLMNRGETQAEIAETLAQPKTLADEWSNRGYYGTYSHNSKAIYQHYLGWYDGNPANLNPHPPQERGKRYVAAMGGFPKAFKVAQKALDAGDYRWASEILSQIVFADPGNQKARSWLADSFEQQGYQAESAIWRNQFLSAASDLRKGVTNSRSTQSADSIAAIPSALLLDSVATRFAPEKLADQLIRLNVIFSDRQETARLTIGNGVMITEMNAAHAEANATLTGPRLLFLGLLFQKTPLAHIEAAGLKISGDRTTVERFVSAIDPIPPAFNIVEP